MGHVGEKSRREAEMENSGLSLTALDWPADDSTNAGSDARGENDECQGELLSLTLVDISNETKSNTTASGRDSTLDRLLDKGRMKIADVHRETDQATSNNHRPPIGSQGSWYLPDVDKKHGQLENRPATKLFTPRCPQLTPNGISDKIDHLSGTGFLLANAKSFGKRFDSIGIDGCVEVHGDLNTSHGRKVCPFLPSWPAVCELVIAVFFPQLALAIPAHIFLLGNRVGNIDLAAGWALRSIFKGPST